jgi:rubrerythrin
LPEKARPVANIFIFLKRPTKRVNLKSPGFSGPPLAETVHARNHLRAMSGIGTLEENLNAAISGEHEEFTAMYPGFIKIAQEEKNSKAESTFNWANKVEKVHHGLYQQALADLKAAKKLENKPFYVCQNCGYTVEGEAPQKCPICGAVHSQFKKID